MRAGDDSEVRETTEQRTKKQEMVGQATSRAAKEERPEVKEVAEVEVPLVKKRKRLMRAREMVPAREGTSAREVCLQGTEPDRGRKKGEREKTRQPKRDPG